MSQQMKWNKLWYQAISLLAGMLFLSLLISPSLTRRQPSSRIRSTGNGTQTRAEITVPFQTLQSRPYLLEGANDRKDLFSSYSEEPGELKNPKYVSLGFTRLTYGDLLAVITLLQRPRRVVEFGVLYGFALDIWIKRSPENCIIEGYDLFQDNDDGHMISRQDEVQERFKGHSNLIIKHAEFYAEAEQILSGGEDVDILHIDVNNSGDTVNFAVEKLLNKVRVGGVIVFEGGSMARDSLAPKKRAMHEVLSAIATRSDIEVMILEPFPSISIVRRLY